MIDAVTETEIEAAIVEGHGHQDTEAQDHLVVKERLIPTLQAGITESVSAKTDTQAVTDEGVETETGTEIAVLLDVMHDVTTMRGHRGETEIYLMIDAEVEHGEEIEGTVTVSVLDQDGRGRKALPPHQRRRSPHQI